MAQDERVASAIAHWGPRFTVNGVTAADFTRVTAGLERWEDWCAAWSRAGSVHEDLGRQALADGRTRSAGGHLARAAVYHHFAKFVFVVDPDQMRAAHARAVGCLTDALPHLDPPGRRVGIPFEGSRLVAVVRTPRGAGPHPVVVLVPGLDSTKEELGSTEQTFLDRGLATFTLDGPGQGEAEYDLAIRGDWAPVAEAVWSTVRDEPDLDQARLAVWGVSLGGYYAARVAAALGDRVAACVTLGGPFCFGECWDGLPQLTRDTFRLRSGAASDDEARDGGADPRPRRRGRRPGLTAAGRLRAAGPADPVAAGGPVALRSRRRGGDAADARGRQPRLRQRGRPHRPRTADWLVARHAGGPEPSLTYAAPTPTIDEGRMTMDTTDAATPGTVRVGWIGTGRMGAAMASRLARAGTDMTVWNRTRSKAEPLTEAGCAVADTIVGAARARRRLHDGVHPRRPGAGPARRGWAPRRPGPGAGRRGRLLDGVDRVVCGHARSVRRSAASPSSPRRSAATARSCAAGGLSLVVSGPEETYDRVAHLLAHIGKSRDVRRRGDVARLVKICHNLMLGVVTQSMAEITVLAEKGGVPRAAFLEFLNNSVMGSVFTRYKTPGLRATWTTPRPSRPILLRKDFDLGLAAAREPGRPDAGRRGHRRSWSRPA